MSVTCGGLWRAELQRVSQDDVVVPDVQLVVSGIVADGGDVLVRVGERDPDWLLSVLPRVVSIQDQVSARLTVIILVYRTHGVQDATCHERFRRHALLETRLPRSLEAQSVRVHLKCTCNQTLKIWAQSQSDYRKIVMYTNNKA